MSERRDASDSWLTGRIVGLTRLALAAPAATIVLSIAVAAVGVVFAVRHLEYNTRRLDLINPQDAKHQLWLDYIEEFGADDDAVIVVEGPGHDAIVPALRDLADSVAGRDDLFHSVFDEIDLSVLWSRPLHFLPPPAVAGIDQFLGQIAPVLSGNWEAAAAVHTIPAISQAAVQSAGRSANDPARRQAEQAFSTLAAGLEAALVGRPAASSLWAATPMSLASLSEPESQYLVDSSGRLGFVFLRLADLGENSFARHKQPISVLRQLIEAVELSHPNVEISLTGIPVMEHDEMVLSEHEMTNATLIGLVGVFALFVAGFGALRHSFIAVAVLVLGMLWSLIAITIYPGHLNILSSAFAVVLIGLGINYPIHYIACYLDLRSGREAGRETIEETARYCGKAIAMGAATTALAFFASAMTEFRGVAELGFIAGSGVLVCMLATLVALPAALLLADPPGSPRRLGFGQLPVAPWMRVIESRPRTVLAASLAATLAAAAALPFVEYDHNLLNLQADGVESVDVEKRLLNEYNQSVWFALSLADSQAELRRREAEFRALPTVERTESIGAYLPAIYVENGGAIAAIARRLVDLPERPGEMTTPDAAVVAAAMKQAEDALAAAGQDRLANQAQRVRQALRRLPEDVVAQRLERYQQETAGDLLNRLYRLAEIANPQPPTLEDLPPALVDRFVGSRGRHLLKVYAQGDAWDMEALKRFVRDVRSVDPRATGHPVQTFEASRKMLRSYEQAAVLAMAGILAAIWWDFRRPIDVLLAVIPLLLSLIQTFGLMAWLGLPLNPANTIALPLLIGLGVEDGVHLVHDFHRRRGRYSVSNSVALGVVLTSATTIASFAALMLASHQGLYSLGRVMTIGVACCLITSLAVLPALLVILSQRDADGAAAEASTPLEREENAASLRDAA